MASWWEQIQSSASIMVLWSHIDSIQKAYEGSAPLCSWKLVLQCGKKSVERARVHSRCT